MEHHLLTSRRHPEGQEKEVWGTFLGLKKPLQFSLRKIFLNLHFKEREKLTMNQNNELHLNSSETPKKLGLGGLPQQVAELEILHPLGTRFENKMKYKHRILSQNKVSLKEK